MQVIGRAGKRPEITVVFAVDFEFLFSDCPVFPFVSRENLMLHQKSPKALCYVFLQLVVFFF